MPETEANISRGYAIEEVVQVRKQFVDCGFPPPTPENPDPAPERCLQDVPYETRQPVAIDLSLKQRTGRPSTGRPPDRSGSCPYSG